MREIFTELYNKVLSFFQAQEKESSESKTVAVNRMKLVLMQDRTNLTPFLLERMRGEMIQVLAKYVEMDQEALELNFEQEGEQMALMLSIPVLRAKEEDEIKAIIEAEDAAKAEAEAKEEEESLEEISEEALDESREDESEKETSDNENKEITEESESEGEEEASEDETEFEEESEETEEGSKTKKSRKK